MQSHSNVWKGDEIKEMISKRHDLLIIGSTSLCSSASATGTTDGLLYNFNNFFTLYMSDQIKKKKTFSFQCPIVIFFLVFNCNLQFHASGSLLLIKFSKIYIKKILLYPKSNQKVQNKHKIEPPCLSQQQLQTHLLYQKRKKKSKWIIEQAKS